MCGAGQKSRGFVGPQRTRSQHRPMKWSVDCVDSAGGACNELAPSHLGHHLSHGMRPGRHISACTVDAR